MQRYLGTIVASRATNLTNPSGEFVRYIARYLIR